MTRQRPDNGQWPQTVYEIEGELLRVYRGLYRVMSPYLCSRRYSGLGCISRREAARMLQEWRAAR